MTVAILKRDDHTIQIFVVTHHKTEEENRTEAYNNAWMRLHGLQPASCDHAMKYEGYRIEATP
jgi:hypothetical protein